jgi:hypothetical protein
VGADSLAWLRAQDHDPDHNPGAQRTTQATVVSGDDGTDVHRSKRYRKLQSFIKTVEEFLAVFNGNWSNELFTHYCTQAKVPANSQS